MAVIIAGLVFVLILDRIERFVEWYLLEHPEELLILDRIESKMAVKKFIYVRLS